MSDYRVPDADVERGGMAAYRALLTVTGLSQTECEDVADSILATVLPEHDRALLLALADEVERGPSFPLPPYVIAELIREKAAGLWPSTDW